MYQVKLTPVASFVSFADYQSYLLTKNVHIYKFKAL